MPQAKLNWAQLIQQLLAILNQIFPQPTPAMTRAQQALAKCPCDHELAECQRELIGHLAEAMLHAACVLDALDPPQAP